MRDCGCTDAQVHCASCSCRGARQRQGSYRCYYKHIKARIEGTTAQSTYVFVRGVRGPSTHPCWYWSHGQGFGVLSR